MRSISMYPWTTFLVFVMTNVGGSLTVSPEGMEEYVRRKPDWSKFVEACFEPGSELNRKLKQMVLNMAEEHSHGVKEG